jgi:hypothetical protein
MGTRMWRGRDNDNSHICLLKMATDITMLKVRGCVQYPSRSPQSHNLTEPIRRVRCQDNNNGSNKGKDVMR